MSPVSEIASADGVAVSATAMSFVRTVFPNVLIASMTTLSTSSLDAPSNTISSRGERLAKMGLVAAMLDVFLQSGKPSAANLTNSSSFVLRPGNIAKSASFQLIRAEGVSCCCACETSCLHICSPSLLKPAIVYWLALRIIRLIVPVLVRAAASICPFMSVAICRALSLRPALSKSTISIFRVGGALFRPSSKSAKFAVLNGWDTRIGGVVNGQASAFVPPLLSTNFKAGSVVFSFLATASEFGDASNSKISLFARMSPAAAAPPRSKRDKTAIPRMRPIADRESDAVTVLSASSKGKSSSASSVPSRTVLQVWQVNDVPV